MASPDGIVRHVNMNTISYPYDIAMLKSRTAYNADGLPEYIGWALAGTATSAIGWQIRKLTYTGVNVTATDFASGTNGFDKIWDNYATYTYS